MPWLWGELRAPVHVHTCQMFKYHIIHSINERRLMFVLCFAKVGYIQCPKNPVA